MMFQAPYAWFLLLLGLVPLVVWHLFARRQSVAVRFSSTEGVRALGPTWKTRTQWIVPALRVAAIVLLMIAVARPREGRKRTTVDSEGIAIQMVVDRSGSMQAMDFELQGQPVDRLTAIKDVAGTFVSGDGHLSGRFDDLVGLITFAGYADGVSPLTLDHPYLIDRLNQTEIVTSRNEDGTAIGDAIGLAVEKLQTLDKKRADKTTREVPSKIIILLTDGENNAGALDPIEAAELASALDIKIYTIGVGTKGRAPVPVTDPFTGRKIVQWADVSIDEVTLKEIADTTGGQYYRATDTESLRAIYEEIDRLEKSHVEEHHYVDYRELAIEPIRAGFVTLPPLAAAALVLLVIQIVLGATVYRSIA